MIVELISVGTELLLGNIVNTNAQYLSETCAKLGLNVYYQTTVGDNRARMTEVFRTALSRADLVIIGGGLGPTEDDICLLYTSPAGRRFCPHSGGSASVYGW